MDNKNKEDITKRELLDAINRSFSSFEDSLDHRVGSLENKLDTVSNKVDTLETKLDTFRLETNLRFNDLESDLRSFKLETRQNFVDLNEKFDDQHDTLMNHDKRIEVLEEKVLV
jgi:predicted  nucleic acid-binding Zn-ribbon protein